MENLQFEQSEKIGNLIKSLINVQQENITVKKEGESGGTGNFKYKYANLDDILRILRPILSKNGLVISQIPLNGSESHIGILNMVMHESGEFMKSYFEIAIDPTARMNTTQKHGSAITYARRYCIASIFNIALEDDDAGGLHGDKKPVPKKQQKPVDNRPQINSTQLQQTFQSLDDPAIDEEKRISMARNVIKNYKVPKEHIETITQKVENIKRELELQSQLKTDEEN